MDYNFLKPISSESDLNEYERFLYPLRKTNNQLKPNSKEQKAERSLAAALKGYLGFTLRFETIKGSITGTLTEAEADYILLSSAHGNRFIIPTKAICYISIVNRYCAKG